MYSAENETLNQQVGQLHEEIRNLRTLLMGHKDCPVGHAQGIGQFLNGMQDPNSFNPTRQSLWHGWHAQWYATGYATAIVGRCAAATHVILPPHRR